MNWQRFVALYGVGALSRDLAHVLGIPIRDIDRFRDPGLGAKPQKPRGFAELYSLWHGHEPRDDEWPKPGKSGGDSYEWLGPEDAALAKLVGRLNVPQIAEHLTNRLRTITGDPKAIRTLSTVESRIHRIGLHLSDLPGGLTTSDAGRIVGGRQIIEHALRKGMLRTVKTGHLHLIPYAVWDEFMASRKAPPEGYVLLRRIRDSLGLTSDKLQAYAARGLVPTAVRCFPRGVGGPSSRHGVFYLDPAVANKLVEDRRAGRPMPWFKKPDPHNLKVTWKLYQDRRHPASCTKCGHIWGEEGAPHTFGQFETRYPPLDHGAKRHLTFKWNPGHTVVELAKRAKVTVARVQKAIAAGALTASGKPLYITKTDAARWITRKCPTGSSASSWLTADAALRDYGFSRPELDSLVSTGQIVVKPGTHGGSMLVSRQQCLEIRAAVGFSLSQAAQMLDVPTDRAAELLKGLNWRKAQGYPLEAIKSAKQRLESAEGYSITQAAEMVQKSSAWVNEQIDGGLIRVSKPAWSDRVYIAAPMVARLRAAATAAPHGAAPPDWISVSKAAAMAGVSTGTIDLWKGKGLLETLPGSTGARFNPHQVKERAREFWRTSRSKRPFRPAWLEAEISAAV